MTAVVMQAERCIADTAVIRSNFEFPIDVRRYADIQPGGYIGGFSSIGDFTAVGFNVTIGRYCSIGPFCNIGAHRHPTSFLSTHSFQYSSDGFSHIDACVNSPKIDFTAYADKTCIGNDVWIGSNVTVLTGVVVGDGAVLGAGSVVTKDVAPYAIVAGVPARTLRYRFGKEIVDDLMDLKWWDLPFGLSSRLPFADIESCVRILKDIRRDQESSARR